MAGTKSGSSVPVSQMLSGKHDNNTIAKWLKTFVDVVRGPPKEVVIDESAALLLASIKAFTQFNSVPSYLNRCHMLLELGQLSNNDMLPKCFIRHDISHIVKNLIKAKIFEKCQERKKKFYLYAIGSLFAIEHFQAVKMIMKDILILALCPFESEVTENSRRNLKSLIETHHIEDLYIKNSGTTIECDENVIGLEHAELDDITISTKHPEKKIINWWEQIKENVLKISITNKNVYDKDNEYFFPSIIPFLDKMIYKIPTWSAVMKNLFKSPNANVSSSNCESQFKYIKRYLFKNSKNMRVDKFLFGHINDLVGCILLATADLNNFKIKL